MDEDTDLWGIALAKLDSKTTELLKQGSPDGGQASKSVVTVIAEIRSGEADRARKENGWTVALPQFGHGKAKVVSLRNMVFSIMEAALQFNDIVTKVLAFGATKYGQSIVKTGWLWVVYTTN